MQIAMLGPLEVRTDAGEARAISGVRLARLLIALALQPGRVVSTSYLVDAVWDDEPPDETGNAVQALVSRLRRAVPGIEVASRAQGYVLEIDPQSVDVQRFETLVADGRRIVPAEPADASGKLREALALWRGPPLVDAGEAEFAQAPRARLDELRLDALQARIDVDLRRGLAPDLVAELEGLVVSYPLREAFVKLLMRALQASGDRGRALSVYEAARTRLSDELGVAPSADLAAEHVRILRADDEGGAVAHAGTVRDRPAADRTGLSSPAAADDLPPLTNLRADISSFVGRERDIDALDELMAAHRLVTLTGPGGAGKTRLASHVSRHRLDAMPDGVWMVELAPVTEPADVVVTVLDVLGVRDRALVRSAGSPMGVRDSVGEPVDRLVSALRERRAMLVFDNCEHLIDSAADLVGTILGACPLVRIVTTSREPLGLTGEALWPVEPLAVAPTDPVPPAEELTSYAGVRLLVQRAAAVRPGFAVTDDNAAVVAHVVHALDGMPLAIELAAARLRAMPIEQLASRLDDRFALLTAGSRTAVPRHQTLRAVVDWSWDLLGEPERVLWRRMSTFTGGATLAAIEYMSGDGALGEMSALDALTALVDRSLVTVREDAAEPRYHMLETIRAYGQMRLDESGDEATAQERHADYFRDLARRARDELRGRDQLEWFARLTTDHDNLNAAVRNATAAGDARTAVSLVGSLGWYWWLRGHRNEGVELVKAALGIADAEPAGDEREELAIAYTVGALLAIDGTHDVSLARGWFENAADLARRVGRPIAPFLRLIGPLRGVFDMMPHAGFRQDVVVDIPIDDPDPWVAGTARIIRAHVQLNYGRGHDQANEDFEIALRAFRALGERWGIAFSLVSLGSLAGWRGDIKGAITDFEDAVRAVSEMGAWEERVSFRAQLARLLWLDGDRDRAYETLALAERDAHRVAAPEEQGAVAWVAADLARYDGDLVRAEEHLRRAEQLAADHNVAPQLRALVIGTRAYVESARGDRDEARRHQREAIEVAMSSIDAPVIAQVLVGLADVALADGDAELAASILGASAGVRGTPDLSLIDGRRVTEAARKALGGERFDEAYQRGLTMTTAQVGRRAGVELPELTAARNAQ